MDLCIIGVGVFIKTTVVLGGLYRPTLGSVTSGGVGLKNT